MTVVLRKVILKRTIPLILCAVLLSSLVPTLAIHSFAQAYGETYTRGEQSLTWRLDSTSGLLTISCDGAMIDFTSGGNAPWHKYKAQIKSVKLEEGVTHLGNYALNECSNLRQVSLPTTLTHIGECAFRKCTALASLTVPEGVMEIAYHAFYECTALSLISLPTTLISLDKHAFDFCPCVKSNNPLEEGYYVDNWLISEYASKQEITLREGTVGIANEVFKYANTRTIHIPDTVVSICAGAFTQANLASIKLPKNLKAIGDNAFSFCYFSSVEIPDSVEYVGDYAFHNCTSLTEVSLGDSVTYIGQSAFYRTKIESLLLPQGLKYIGNSAFSFCEQLEGRVEVPSSVTHLGAFAFRYCKKISEISLPATVREIGERTFDQCTSLAILTVGAYDTVIFDREDTIPEDTVIYGYPNSTAKAYADKYERVFLEMTCDHTLGAVYSIDDTYHRRSCPCGEQTEDTAHTEGDGRLVTEASCTKAGVYEYNCTACGNIRREETAKTEHTYNQQIAEKGYLATAATCTEKATYYLSCACGAAGSETFVYGNVAAHSFGAWTVTTPATEQSVGVKTRGCTTCDHKETQEIPMLRPNVTSPNAQGTDTVEPPSTNAPDTQSSTANDVRDTATASGCRAAVGEINAVWLFIWLAALIPIYKKKKI